ncbi:MAG: hypothetical protein GMKNLPBB_00441 [Myxococcota bacterium]|nr:hypothetical protein [Myxococcota bacterium]
MNRRFPAIAILLAAHLSLTASDCVRLDGVQSQPEPQGEADASTDGGSGDAAPDLGAFVDGRSDCIVYRFGSEKSVWSASQPLVLSFVIQNGCNHQVAVQGIFTAVGAADGRTFSVVPPEAIGRPQAILPPGGALDTAKHSGAITIKSPFLTSLMNNRSSLDLEFRGVFDGVVTSITQTGGFATAGIRIKLIP